MEGRKNPMILTVETQEVGRRSRAEKLVKTLIMIGG